MACLPSYTISESIDCYLFIFSFQKKKKKIEFIFGFGHISYGIQYHSHCVYVFFFIIVARIGYFSSLFNLQWMNGFNYGIECKKIVVEIINGRSRFMHNTQRRNDYFLFFFCKTIHCKSCKIRRMLDFSFMCSIQKFVYFSAVFFLPSILGWILTFSELKKS